MNKTKTITLQFKEPDFFDTLLLSLYLPLNVTSASSAVFYLLKWSLLTLFLVVILSLMLRWRLQKKTQRIVKDLPSDSRNNASAKIVTIGFFHPYCNAGGGGERVLWCAIRTLQTRYDFVKCVVYTGDIYVNPEEILKRARQRFNIELKRNVHFVYLNSRPWVTAERYPILTLLGQSIGSVILGLEALCQFTPDVYLDTMGYAFTLPLFKFFGGCKVGSYIHYPTISTDMLEKVNRRQVDFNNAKFISQSVVLSFVKLFYYKLFAFCYGMCGRCSDVVMVNSSWTLNHINQLWNVPRRTSIVFPPCNTKSLLELSIDEMESYKAIPKQIISIAQFRPEKNHLLQLQVFGKFLKKLSQKQKGKYKLLMVGSCRDNSDEDRVKLLQEEAKKLKIDKFVVFHLNVSYEILLDLISESIVGLHTMQDEHFGIGVVEYMAGGLITLAHNSAGPKMDIVIEWEDKPTGFLADSTDTYVDALVEIFNMSSKERFEICRSARECVNKRFSEDTFSKKFLSETEPLLM